MAKKGLRVGVLTNPLSGRNKNRGGAVEKTLRSYPAFLHREVQTPQDVASALVEFSSDGVDVLAVDGGDGTVHSVLTTLFHLVPFETLPLLALLRSGTDNMIARDVGVKGSQREAARKLIAWIRQNQRAAIIVNRPILRVQIAPDREPLYGMFFGAGAIHQLIHSFSAKMHSFGLYGELVNGLTLLRSLLGVAFGRRDYITPVRIKVFLNATMQKEETYMVLFISTLERLFLGIRPFWGKEPAPLRFSAVGGCPHHLLRAVPSLVRGRIGRHGTPENGYFSHNVDNVQLHLDSGFTIDGEVYEPDAQFGPITIRNGGQAAFLSI
jgi:diacylglycerol kinase family enzyme